MLKAKEKGKRLKVKGERHFSSNMLIQSATKLPKHLGDYQTVTKSIVQKSVRPFFAIGEIILLYCVINQPKP